MKIADRMCNMSVLRVSGEGYYRNANCIFYSVGSSKQHSTLSTQTHNIGVESTILWSYYFLLIDLCLKKKQQILI